MEVPHANSLSMTVTNSPKESVRAENKTRGEHVTLGSTISCWVSEVFGPPRNHCRTTIEVLCPRLVATPTEFKWPSKGREDGVQDDGW